VSLHVEETSPSVTAYVRLQSRLVRPVLAPERFRGVCPFGAPIRIAVGTLPGGVDSASDATRCGGAEGAVTR
jgi:hypothetical protein